MASIDQSSKKIKPEPIRYGLSTKSGLTPLMNELKTNKVSFSINPRFTNSLKPTLDSISPTLDGISPTLDGANSAFYKPKSTYFNPDLSQNRLYRKRMARHSSKAAENTAKENEK